MIQPGQSIGRYHVIDQLGEGGMAFVYRAYDTRLERDVAIKVIRPEVFSPIMLERVLKRFEREAKLLAKLSHPNIVKMYDFGSFEGSPYLVMEYIPGGTLKKMLGKPMPYQEASRLLLPIAYALDYAHQQKPEIIHRDVKPSNILLTSSGEPMLSDFGIAKILETNEGGTLTGTGVGLGTPEYMSPEQGIGKEVDGRADIYSLGIVYYELITGRKPYTADTPIAVVIKQLNDPLPPPKVFIPDLPDEVENFIYKALAKQPQDRYDSMQEVIQALENLRFNGKSKKAGSITPNLSQYKQSNSSFSLPKAGVTSTQSITYDELVEDVATSKSSNKPSRAKNSANKWGELIYSFKSSSRNFNKTQKAVVMGATILILAIVGVAIFSGRLLVGPSPDPTITSSSVSHGDSTSTASVVFATNITLTAVYSVRETSVTPTFIIPTAKVTIPPTLTSNPTLGSISSTKIILIQNANIRSGPGTVYPILTSFVQDKELSAIGRDASGAWLCVQLDNNKTGWISTKLIQINVSVNNLLEIKAPPTPTPLPPTSESNHPNPGKPATNVPPYP